MRQRLAGAALVAAGIVAAAHAACTFGSLDDLARGPGDAASQTDGRASSDAASPDGTTDGSSSDAAATDADALADAPFRVCSTVTASPSVFCADFDDGSTSAWTGALLQPASAGPPVLDDARALTPPDSLLASVPATSGTAGVTSVLYKDLGAAATTSAHLEYDVFVAAVPAGTDVILSTIQLGPQPGSYGVDIRVRDATADIQQVVPLEGGARDFVPSAVAGAPRLGGWTHVEMDLTLSSSSPTVSLSFDHVAAIVPPKPLDPRYLTGAARVLVGVPFVPTPTSTAVTLHFDDVLFRVN